MRKNKQYYMTYLSQTYNDKFVGNIQFSYRGKLSKEKIKNVLFRIKKETQAEKVVILNIIRI